MRFTAKIILLTVSKKFIIFWRTIVIFWKQPTIWTFLEILLFQLHYTANLLPPAIFDKFKIFFSKNPFFFQNSSIYLIFLRNLSNRVAIYRVAFYSKLATITEFWKTETFFGITLFWKEPNFWTFWEISLFHSYSASFCLSSACFKKLKFRFQKNHLFFWITQTLIFLRNHTVSVAFYNKFATISIFWNFQYFFSENQYISLKKPKCW